MRRRDFLVKVPPVVALTFIAPSALSAAAPAQQSPIDIITDDAVFDHSLPRLKFRYESNVAVQLSYISRDSGVPLGCSLRDHEEVVQAAVPAGAGLLRIGDTIWDLVQFHWHRRSEHRINGRDAPMEQHFVHRAGDGRLLVVGVFIREGHGKDSLNRIFQQLPQECAGTVPVPGIDLDELLPGNRSSFRYSGSLTTSPFTEGVSWVVLPAPIRLGESGIERYRALFPDGNSREVQPRDGRIVRFRPQGKSVGTLSAV
ncbi:MAG TPA: carbonic anhydrase family protein [Pseudonocardiaceae bacterium]|jgi:carbonic anhydrase